MPLSEKGKAILKNMQERYGAKEGKSVFYASENKGNISGIEKARKITSGLKEKKNG